MTGADILVNALKERGITFVSTLCGNGLNPFYVACRKFAIRLIDMRNEQAASYAADAYARLTRRVGVCAVSSAVGHTNALIGMVNAYFDGAPLLLISGASPQDTTDMGKFQELDQIAMAAPVCKYARLVDRAERIPFYVHEAFATATNGRPGPVHLTVPIDVLETEVDLSKMVPMRLPGTHKGEVEQFAQGDADLISEAAKLLAKAKRPVLVAGTGVFYAKGDNVLERLAEMMAIPVVVPIWDRGAIPRPVRHFLGVIGAASGGPNLLPDADVVILVGARTDYRIGYAQPPTVKKETRIVRIDLDAEELHRGVEPDISILGDPRSVLEQLTEELKSHDANPYHEWLEEARRRYQTFHRRWIETLAPAAPPMTGRHIVDALRPFLQGDTLFLVDGGNIGQWAHMALCDRYPDHWLTCGASAVVGWGLPGAVGAKLAYPDRPVILLSGDGALTFTIAEFEPAVRHNTPFVVVLADDQAWGIVVSGQRKQYSGDGVIASQMGPIRYDMVAQGFGAIGLKVERPEEIAPAIEQGLKADRPTLIHVPIMTLGPADE